VYELYSFDNDSSYHSSSYKSTSIKETSSGCFIATAVYGSYDTPELIILRTFRDQVLLNSLPGKIFVKAYYYLSPPIANFIQKSKILKTTVRRLIIGPLIYALKNQNRRK
jgi:hypothetical protein